MKYFILTLAFLLISTISFSQKKYIELQEVKSEVILPQNSFLIVNNCPFKIKFKITHQSEKVTLENLMIEEHGLYWIDTSCKVTIIREGNKPSSGDTYQILEGRKYSFDYDSNSDIISIIEYVL